MQLEELLLAARRWVEDSDNLEGAKLTEAKSTAMLMYRILLQETKPPYTSAIQRIARGEACVFMAREALSRYRRGTAGDWYREALDADPRCAAYRTEYAMKVLIPMGLDEAALIEAKRAARIDPDDAIAWRQLGIIEHAIGSSEGSLEARRRALALLPDDPVILLDMAVWHIDAMEYDKASEYIDKVLMEHPERAGDATNLLGCISYREGDHNEAILLMDRALELGVEDPANCRWNKALALHSIGRYREGWEEYEQRQHQKALEEFTVPFKRFLAPLWRGEPTPARIHLHEEMGHGDTLAMIRYAPLLAEMGYDVRVEVRDSMVELFQHSMPRVEVMAKSFDYPRALNIPDFDYHLPMLSLPHRFKTEIDTIPWKGPYLFAPNPIKPFGFGPRIGLCWSSGIRKGIWLGEYGRRKSMAFKELAPLLAINAQFVSLQCGPPAKENDLLPGLSEQEPSWAETANLIASLDLIITVDSSIAHLAGAMGKPTWLMMHTEGSWHWMADTPNAPWQLRSPWYPSVYIFRQKNANEWGSVIERIVRKLRETYI